VVREVVMEVVIEVVREVVIEVVREVFIEVVLLRSKRLTNRYIILV